VAQTGTMACPTSAHLLLLQLLLLVGFHLCTRLDTVEPDTTNWISRACLASRRTAVRNASIHVSSTAV